MTFAKLQEIIDDIVEFIINAVDSMTKFIEGFKTTTTFDPTALDAIK